MHAVCADYNHVRSWSVTRFRGMINTQPGSVPLASFKVMSFEDMEPPINYADGNNFGRVNLAQEQDKHARNDQ